MELITAIILGVVFYGLVGGAVMITIDHLFPNQHTVLLDVVLFLLWPLVLVGSIIGGPILLLVNRVRTKRQT